MAKLSALLARLPASAQVAGDPELEISSIELDSRSVRSGALFVALRGQHGDGHDHIAQAIAAGATALLVEGARLPVMPPHVTVIHVPDTRVALSPLSAAFYGDPSQSLEVIGVTGTNGKTTTTRMIAAILNGAGRPCGVIGTVGAEFGERIWKLANTTPQPPELHGLLAQMRDLGARAVAMEVSSHALALNRVDDVAFPIGVLTNVTRDHLDFHGTEEAYAAAKRELFRLAGAAVLNVDDPHGAKWAVDLQDRGTGVTTYALHHAAQIVARHVETHAGGSRFAVDGRRYEIRLPGAFNVSNALAAIGVAEALGIPGDAIAEGLASLERVPGRMEHVAGPVDVVVDYAHTPDALENALRALRETTGGALALVFGCGGDRDRGKRPQMGAIAARLADRIYVTSDNPRGEDPQAIADDILAGVGARAYEVELDRRTAIARAIREAAPGDVVLIAGKGHENYQIVGDRVLEFDDAAIARELLAQRAGV